MDRATELDGSRDDALPQQAAAAIQGSASVTSRQHGETDDRRSSSHGASTTSARPRLDTKSAFFPEFADVGIEETNVASLQPVDQGFGAWSYVAGAFAMYIVVWGFPQAFPVFATYLTIGKDAPYPGSVTLSLLAPGIQDILEGLLFHILPTAAKYRRLLVVAGIGTILVGLLWASWASHDWEIFLALGICFGIGGIILNFVHVSVFSEWFDKKRGQAMGIIWLGFRIGALGLPLICQYLLDTQGFEKTVQVLIAPAVALLVPSILLLRGRYPSSFVQSKAPEPAVSKLTAMRTPRVLFHLLTGSLFFSVVNVPKMFLMAFGADIGLRPSEQAYAFVILILSTMIGTYALGWLSDIVPFQGLLVLSALATSFSHFVVWGFAKDKFALYAYAFVVGLSIGGFDNAMFSLYSEISGSNGQLFTAIHGIFSLVRGSAILSIGPVGVALIRLASSEDGHLYAMGKYKFLVIYAGAMALACALLLFARIMYEKRQKVNT